MNGARGQRGFTLIELVCVLALLSIIALIALPRLQPALALLELRREAQRMATEMRVCQRQAVLAGAAVEMRFHTNAAPPLYRVRDSEGALTDHALAEGVEYAAPPSFTRRMGGIPLCTFLSSGRSDGGTVSLTNGEDVLYVIVYPSTARVRVSRQAPT